ncbi:modular serine protease-like [Drosophila sulfurigaster albostrigata]|uniref:modular serine protease-like n=1 Tax=Drosophila sulfurigaster albostrigata TaxID=89887 RepID=UPI002D21C6A4|nr:modular serine protease-like [Drosophila sulfurigaster albostrigata]
MCMQELRYPHFQCGNGKIIYNSSQLCDNKYDCLDGSDELETHCQFNEKWIPKQAVTCAEPKRNGLKFMSNTTMYAKKKNNETHYFVYASGAVQFECYNSDEDFEGIKWNVCTIDENGNGRWLHELPKCVDNRNKNPKTNGDLGCSLDTYDDYKANLRIWKCSHDGTNCVKKIEPPLTDANVKFNCSKNFMLFPEILREKTFRCRNKTWQLHSQEASPKPRCGKMCSTSELYCLDSMEPKCKTRNGENIECNLTTLEPGTTVTYDCLPQYKETNSKFTSVCLNNGTWEHSGNRMLYCSIKCGVNELQTSMSANAPVTHLHLSPWSVAIYDNKDTQQFQYSCGGVLIRHNFVLTVAHCVSDGINNFGINRFRVMPAQKANVSIIDSHNDCRKTNETNKDEADKHSECWIVQQIIIDPKFNPAEHTFDSALLHLEANPYLPFKIVCIPKIHFLWDKGYTNRKGSVFAWDTEKRKSDQKLNFVIVDGTLNIADNIANRNFYINVTSYGNVKTTLCIGDSGCGFYDDCPNGNKMCLFGIVSTTKTLNENDCTSNVQINSVVHEGTAEFVNKTMNIISNRCPK